MHNELALAIEGNYRTILENLPINDSDFRVADVEKNLDPLIKNVLKAKGQYMSANDVRQQIIFEIILITFELGETEGLLPDLIGKDQIITAAQKFVALVASLPRKYTLTLRLPIKLPENLHEIVLSKDLRIYKELGFSRPLGSSLAPKSPLLELARIKNTPHVYLAVQTAGYSRSGEMTESALRLAYKKLKQFFYLAMNAGCFYDRTWQTSFDPIETYIYNDNLNTPIKVTLPANFQAFLCSLYLPSYAFDPYPDFGDVEEELITPEEQATNFSDRARIATDFIARPADSIVGIDRAIDWALEGVLNKSHENGFIQTCIALEAILGDANLSDMITQRLADRGSYLLTNDRAKRKEIFADLIAIYKLRSSVVHGKHNLAPGEDTLVKKAEYYLSKAILAEVRNLPNLTTLEEDVI